MDRTISKAGCENARLRTIDIHRTSWSNRRRRDRKRKSEGAMSYTNVLTRHANSKNQLSY
jgi:hypothetical protein